MSVREDILTNFETALATITTANSYSMSVDEVLRDVPHSDALVAETTKATIVLEDAGEDVFVGYFESNKALMEISANIRCYVRAARTVVPTDEVGDIQADVMKLIDSPVSLGSNARYAYVKNIRSAVMGDRVAVVELAVGIVYWYTRTTP